MKTYSELQAVSDLYGGRRIRIRIMFIRRDDWAYYDTLKDARAATRLLQKQAELPLVILRSEVFFLTDKGERQAIGELDGNLRIALYQDIAAARRTKAERMAQYDSLEYKKYKADRDMERFLDAQDYYGKENYARRRGRFVSKRMGHGTRDDRDIMEREDGND